ncbi:MvdC/MvdD family ATP grasp protein [Streptomyces olindensis]|uniref:MvdC/MvdD family ATP grasp protein n=1 Tax=Streptomyces olindensis TaxID=358823 RepID=UPI00365A681D
MTETIVFDVGETITRDDRYWASWADWLDVPRHTLSALVGAVVAQGRDNADALRLVRPGSRPTADVVISELHDRDVPVVQLDSGDFPASLSVEAELTEDGLRGCLRTPSRTADLADVRALYYRRPSGFTFPHLDEQDARFAVTQARYGVGGVRFTVTVTPEGQAIRW